MEAEGLYGSFGIEPPPVDPLKGLLRHPGVLLEVIPVADDGLMTDQLPNSKS